jgi:curved DNA-binding protein CbpA
MNKDYYRTLGLMPDASLEEIKRAYRRLAMRYHPDRNGSSSESEDRLKDINEAYQILGDKEKRKHYDQLLLITTKYYPFYKQGINEDIVTLSRTFSPRGRNSGKVGGCRRRGLGKWSCRK